MNFDEVFGDLSAFADDPNDVLIEKNGSVLFVRSGREINFRLRLEDGKMIVVQEDQTSVPYRKFLSHQIARLDTFAERLISKRPPISDFVEGPARAESVSLDLQEGSSLEILHKECVETSPFCSRVVFITADAGHGKTALLKEYQARQAKKFLSGHSTFLFWHVDLQGRQLLRLHEALMGDLGDLRLSGLWMSGIIRLLRHGMLVLAIDGFDELAAEQGRTDALGALATIVQQMQEKGVIVAASRRTFFDTEDYVRRSGLLRSRVSSGCEFDQIHLLNWTRKEGIEYLSKIEVRQNKFNDPQQIYADILHELNQNSSHPMLTRPFLLTHLSRGLLIYSITPSDFIKGMADPLEGVAEVVKAFIEREVSEKWKERDTGEPYLTINQHMELLASVAQEMWSNQVESLGIDVIETITILMLDYWGTAEDRKRQVLEMVKMHVMLTVPQDGDERSRCFDHPEFTNYFVAYYLADLINKSVESNNSVELGYFLSIAQLPDGVARYAATMSARTTDFIVNFVDLMNKLVEKEWKPTFLQTNVGTILPCMINEYCGSDLLNIVGNMVFSSLVFENTTLKNVSISGANFLNVSFVGVKWEHIVLESCEFNEITIDKASLYNDVSMLSCKINSVKLLDGAEETARGYSPERIAMIMNSVGIVVHDKITKHFPCVTAETEPRKLANRILRIFRRTTLLSDSVIRLKIQDVQHSIVFEHIIPLMQNNGLIDIKPWRGGGKQKNLWVLKKSLDEILRADCGEGDPQLVRFWKKLDDL